MFQPVPKFSILFILLLCFTAYSEVTLDFSGKPGENGPAGKNGSPAPALGGIRDFDAGRAGSGGVHGKPKGRGSLGADGDAGNLTYRITKGKKSRDYHSLDELRDDFKKSIPEISVLR